MQGGVDQWLGDMPHIKEQKNYVYLVNSRHKDQF